MQQATLAAAIQATQLLAILRPFQSYKNASFDDLPRVRSRIEKFVKIASSTNDPAVEMYLQTICKMISQSNVFGKDSCFEPVRLIDSITTDSSKSLSALKRNPLSNYANFKSSISTMTSRVLDVAMPDYQLSANREGEVAQSKLLHDFCSVSRNHDWSATLITLGVEQEFLQGCAEKLNQHFSTRQGIQQLPEKYARLCNADQAQLPKQKKTSPKNPLNAKSIELDEGMYETFVKIDPTALIEHHLFSQLMQQPIDQQHSAEGVVTYASLLLEATALLPVPKGTQPELIAQQALDKFCASLKSNHLLLKKAAEKKQRSRN